MTIETCDKCDLCISNSFTPIRPVVGTLTDIMIVCDSPTRNDTHQGQLLQGKNNKYLQDLLKTHNLLNWSYVTTSVKCATPKNRQPSILEISKCKPYLVEELIKYKPKIIILLGGTTIRSFYKTDDVNMTHYHGKMSKHGNAYIFHLYSPAFIQKRKYLQKDYDLMFAKIADVYLTINPLFKWM